MSINVLNGAGQEGSRS